MKPLCKVICIGFLTLVLVSCASSGGNPSGSRNHSTRTYDAIGGENKSLQEISTILLKGSGSYVSDYIDWIIIDGTRVDHKDFGQINIAPGSYTVEWGRKFNISPMVKSSGVENRRWNATLDFLPAHTYAIHARRTVGQGYIIYSWIVDETLNETIWGKEFIPGPYDYLR